MVGKTIKELLNEGVARLKENGIENVLLDAQLILANLLKVDKLYILTNIDQIISEDIEKIFINDILRRAKGMPVQYIIGKQEFMGLEFRVDNNVLIPRPDTEVLVEEVIKSIKPHKEYKILDIGTGTGCIAISLAKNIKNAIIYSVDISQEAIDIAKHNAKMHDLEQEIDFFVGSIFEPLGKEHKFDIIVSNPPYIPSDVIETLEKNVKDYEPILALDGGVDGLDYYREIIEKVGEYLTDDGKIFFEIGYDQAKLVINLLEQNNFSDINIVKDLAGHDRVIKAGYR